MSVGIALRYASLGFAVFPLAKLSKAPAIPKSQGGRGCHDATTELDQIEAWWRQFPAANVGIATGPISRCWVLDIDPESSTEGATWLDRMEAENGPLPITAEARTLKGGRHIVFSWDDNFPVRNRATLDVDGVKILGIDARGDGGYIVAAPSRVIETKNGRSWDGAYEWVRKPSDTPLAAAPAWLLDAVIGKKQAAPHVDYVPREKRDGDGFFYGHAALDRECQAMVTAPPGSQDNQIVSSAYKLGQLIAGGEISRQDAEDALINAAMAIPAQSKSLSEITDKVNRAITAGMEKPRSAPKKQETPKGKRARETIDPETGEVFEDDAPSIRVVGWVENAGWARGLNWSLKDDGALRPSSMNNLTLMFENHPDLVGKLALNRFSYEVWILNGLPCDNGEEASREMHDNDAVAMAGWLNNFGLTLGVQAVEQVMRLVASRNSFDPVEEYLKSLVWDGVPRIDMWLSYYAGAEATPYTKIVGPKFMISAAARVLEPGCKVDTMLVLEGPQGLKKSTLARALFGSEWFSDDVGDVSSKEASIQIQGLWCVEIAEMDRFGRVEDKTVKAFLSRRDDRYRPPYGRGSIKRPRRVVFIGTINPEGSGWMKDATGGRRYWPVTCVSIDIESVMRDRDQLWAEAVVRYRQGQSWWLEEHEEAIAKSEQAARQTEDLWDGKIEAWLATKLPTHTFTNADVVEDALNIALDKRDFRVEKRVGHILTRMGCVPAKPTGMDGKRYRAWTKPVKKETEEDV